MLFSTVVVPFHNPIDKGCLFLPSLANTFFLWKLLQEHRMKIYKCLSFFDLYKISQATNSRAKYGSLECGLKVDCFLGCSAKREKGDCTSSGPFLTLRLFLGPELTVQVWTGRVMTCSPGPPCHTLSRRVAAESLSCWHLPCK